MHYIRMAPTSPQIRQQIKQSSMPSFQEYCRVLTYILLALVQSVLFHFIVPMLLIYNNSRYSYLSTLTCFNISISLIYK